MLRFYVGKQVTQGGRHLYGVCFSFWRLLTLGGNLLIGVTRNGESSFFTSRKAPFLEPIAKILHWLEQSSCVGN